MSKEGTDPEITKDNMISVTGFIWNTDGLPHPDDIAGIGTDGWQGGEVMVKKTDLEKLGFIQKPAETGTIQIETSEGLVQDVKGLPEGYQYEIVECDKHGEPLPKETPQSCDECSIPTPDPEKDCGSCEVPLKE